MQTIIGEQISEQVVQPRFQLPQPVLVRRTRKPSSTSTATQVMVSRSVGLARVARLSPANDVAGVFGSAPIAGAPDANEDRSLIEALLNSKVYQEYERAFTEATGLPIALRPVETWQLPLHGKRREAPYCAYVAEKSRACSSCLQMQERLTKAAEFEPHTMVCSSGLYETAVPIRLGDRLIGYLQTGQVFHKKPTASQFEHTAAMVADLGVTADREQLRDAYFATPVMPQKQQESAVTLLRLFAQHLSMLSNQILVKRQNSESPVITKAKAYIQEHYTDEISLGEVAKAVCSSTFYFCKMFKKSTGINFTDYLSRIRIEKAKNLLLNPNLRVSEIAYEVGFQSLTHFNRVFKRVLGHSPTDYRSRALGAL